MLKSEQTYPPLSYLGAPYSHPDPAVVEDRMTKICKVNAVLMYKGEHVYSPLLNHYVVQHGALPTDWKYFQGLCYNTLNRCDELIIMELDGWEESKGLAEEIKFASERGLKIRRMIPFVIEQYCQRADDLKNKV